MFLGFKSRFLGFNALLLFIFSDISARHVVISTQIDSVPSSLSRTLKGYFIFFERTSWIGYQIDLVFSAVSPMASRV